MGDGNVVAFEVHALLDDVFREIIGVFGNQPCRAVTLFNISNRRRDFHLFYRIESGVDGGMVHRNHFFAFFAEFFLGSFFHVLQCVFRRNDVGEFEESSLHNRTDAFA